MVGLSAVRGDDDENAENEEEVEDKGKPAVGWPNNGGSPIRSVILVPEAKDGSKQDDDP